MNIDRETADKYQGLFNYLNDQYGINPTIEGMNDLIAEVDKTKQLLIPLVGSSTFFKVTFAYDKSKQGRSVWRYEEKVFEVNTADELDSKIKTYIRECTTRLVDRWYYMQKTKVEKM